MSNFITLRDLITESNFSDFSSAQGSENWLDKVGVDDYSIKENGDQIDFKITLLIDEEFGFTVPGVDSFGLYFILDESGNTTITVSSTIKDSGVEITLEDVNVVLRFPANILKPVELVDGVYYVDEDKENFEIELSGINIKYTSGEGFTFDSDGNPLSISLDPVMIGSSGIVIESDDINLYISSSLTPPTGQKAGFKGIFIESAKIHLPEGLNGILPENIAFENCAIGSGGFSGEIYLDYTASPLSGRLFEMSFSLLEIGVQIKQNSLTDFYIDGSITVPFFDKPLGVSVNLDNTGNFNIALSSESGLISLEKEDVISLELSSTSFEKVDDLFIIKLSGKLTPLFGDLEWPTFEVKELSVDSDGNIKLEGGWLDFPDQYTLMFYGFQMEISQLGFGKNDDGSKWIGFSGGLQLVEGLQAGASVEGLRITWTDDENGIPSNIGISFNGVGVEFEIPETLLFKGFVSFRQFTDDDGAQVNRFDGAIELELITLNMGIKAQLVIGTAESNSTVYPFMAIYLGVDLPAGIPLWSTGLALFGFEGLFALQMEPDKGSDEEWYGVGDGEGWYKRSPVGVAELVKWKNNEGSFALGAGITIGTLPDNGFTFNGRMLLAIVFPGPIILIEGNANLLKDRAKLTEEPLFRTIIVIDGREGTITAGLDAQYKFGSGGELLDMHGGAEAFFSFSDPMQWHLYLGVDEPSDERIRAEIFQLFEANAYFMVDAYSVAFGVWVGYDKTFRFGPLKVVLEAWLEAGVKLSYNPAHLYGMVWAHGKVELSAFGFGVGLSVDAKLECDVFDPFHILGQFTVSIGLPWPLDDISQDVTIEWGPEPTAPQIPAPLKEVAVEHFKVKDSWPLVIDSSSNPPVIPLDGRPHITFNFSVKDESNIGVNATTPEPEEVVIGDPSTGEGPVKVQYVLEDVSFEKKSGSSWISVPSAEDGGMDIYGSWATVPDSSGNATSNTKLWLWSKSGFDFTRQLNKSWEEWFEKNYGNYPCPQPPKSETVCYDFNDVPQDEVYLDEFVHPDESGLVIAWAGPEVHMIKKIPPEKDDIKSGDSLNAFCFNSNWDPKKKTDESPYEIVVIKLPYCCDIVELYLFLKLGFAVFGYNDKFEMIYSEGIQDVGYKKITVQGRDDKLFYIVLVTISQFCLYKICLTTTPTEVEMDRYYELTTHVKASAERWEDIGEVFEPFTEYRLKIKTRWDTSGTFGSSLSSSAENYAYFKTEGPIGFANITYTDAEENEKHSLDDLTLYINQTIPETVISEGEKPILPKPVYRAYDIGAQYTENYVDLMFKIAGKDLHIYLFNSNNKPVRGLDGKILVIENSWGETSEQSLSESEMNYVSMLNKSKCISISLDNIPGNNTSSGILNGNILDPDTVYEARIMPLLLLEDFTEDFGLWEELTDGTLNGPASWNWVNHEKIEGDSSTISGNIIILSDSPDLSGLISYEDTIYIENDTSRNNKTYIITSIDNTNKKLSLDANPSVAGSSSWEISERGYIEQTSNVCGINFIFGNSVGSPGTYYMLMKSKISSENPLSWTDYRFTLKIRSNDNDSIGFVFRHNGSSFYRFSMDNERKFRRLIKCVDGVYTILKEDSFVYSTGMDYEFCVEAIGDTIKIYQDGDVVFDVTDSEISAGTIGLYCSKNVGSRFGNIKVEDFSESALSVYTYTFTTSSYSNFYHYINSFQNELWELGLDSGFDLSSYFSKAVDETADTSEEEFKAYDELTRAILEGNANQNPPEIQLSKMILDDKIKGLLLQGPEPLLWDRCEIELQKASYFSNDGIKPGDLKISEASIAQSLPKEESVSVLMRNSVDINNSKIQYYGFGGLIFTSGSEILFYESFDYEAGLLYKELFGSNALDLYNIIDSGKTTLWKAGTADIVHQVANIVFNPLIITTPKKSQESFLILKDRKWNNFKLSATLSSEGSSSIGIAFRYSDQTHYYAFIMNKVEKSRKLIKVSGTDKTIFWEDNEKYVSGKTYDIEIYSYENHISGYIDKELMFNVIDSSSLTSGSAGFISASDNDSSFKSLSVESLDFDPVQYYTDFTTLSFTGKTGLDRIKSIKWKSGTFLIPSKEMIPDTETLEFKLDSYSVIDINDLRDIRVSATIKNLVNSGGIRFRIKQNESDSSSFDYYQFYIDTDEKKRKLIKRVNEHVTLLWQDLFTASIPSKYEVVLEAIGDEITVYFDGDLLLQLNDSAIAMGGIAISTNDDLFDSISVLNLTKTLGSWEIEDSGELNSPSVWRCSNGLAEQTSMIYSSSLTDTPGTFIINGNDEWNNYSIESSLKYDGNGTAGIIFRYSDLDNYYFIEFNPASGNRRLLKNVNGAITVLKELTEIFDMQDFITLKIEVLDSKITAWHNSTKILETIDTSHTEGKIGIFTSKNENLVLDSIKVERPEIEVYTMFKDDFASDSLSEWSISDQGTTNSPSNWIASEGILNQTSQIGNDSASKEIIKKGTMILAGSNSLADYIYSATIMPRGSGEVGIVFRFKDKKNYYSYIINKTNKYRKLIVVKNDVPKVLWSDKSAFSEGENYKVDVLLKGDNIYIFVNELLTVSVKDSAVSKGKIGLHSWKNDKTAFSNIKVYSLEALDNSYLMFDDFTEDIETNWIKNDDWMSSSGYAQHKNKLVSIVGKKVDSQDSIFLSVLSFNETCRLYASGSAATGSMGIVFNYKDQNDYYAFIINHTKGYAELLKKDSTKYTQLSKATYAYTPGSVIAMGVDLDEDTAICYINGITILEAQLNIVTDGQVGLLASFDSDVKYSSFMILPGIWNTFYEFYDEDLYPDGTLFRVYSGNSNDVTETILTSQSRYCADITETGNVKLLGNVKRLRLISSSEDIIDDNFFIKEIAYIKYDIKIIRKQDASGIYIFADNADGSLEQGAFRIKLTFRRDNRSIDSESMVWSQSGITDQETVYLYFNL